MDWEPSYGFCAGSVTDTVALAMTLEAIRRQICAYGGGNRCDCKYGLTLDPTVEVPLFGFMGTDNGVRGTRYDSKTNQHVLTPQYMGSEQTGCPELRELIHRLLHRPETIGQPLVYEGDQA